MIPLSFDYRRATSVEHALELMQGADDAKVLAGGHSLVPLLKLRLAQPSVLVDIARVEELAYIRLDGDEVAIGALTRHHDVDRSDLLRKECPLVAETAALVGDPQVRHRGTIGGSVVHADPASDLPTALLACDATFVLQSPRGQRVVPAGDFFVGFLTSALEPVELLTEIRVPRFPANTRACYLKFNRRAQDWATVGVALVARAGGSQVESAAIALTNMGPTPLRARAAEQVLAGADIAPDTIGASARAAVEGTTPPSDSNGSADYRRHLGRVLVERALERSLVPAVA